MKLFLITFFIGLSAAAKLSNTYLPPTSAGSAGGHGGFLQGPSQQYPQQINRPTNQYIPPQTNYNQQGQPVQWSHGGWNNGGGSGSGSNQLSGSSSNYHQQQQQQQHHQQQHHQQQQQSGPVIPILKYENINDGSGTYNYEYLTGNGIHAQEQGHINNPNTDWAENSVQGAYSYTGDDGKQYSIQYEADGNGFRPVGDHLPTPPPQPREIQEVWDRVLAEQAQHAAQGGWQSQQGSHQQGNYASGSGQYPQQRPQSPNNQYLPPQSAGGYQY